MGLLMIEKIVATSASPAYSSGDCIGGLITLDAGEVSSKDGDLLHMLTIIDKSNQKSDLKLILFQADPTSASLTDNGAFSWGSDIGLCVGVVSIVAADYVTINSQAVATVSNVGCKFRGNGNTCYAVLMSSGTPTYAVNALILKFGLVLNT